MQKGLRGGGKRGRVDEDNHTMLFAPVAQEGDSEVVSACIELKSINFTELIESMPLNKLELFNEAIKNNSSSRSGNNMWFIKPYLEFVPQWVALQD